MVNVEGERSSDKSIVDIQGLSFAYHTKEGPVLRGIDLQITEGSIVLIAGKSGSAGKTTLLKLITGLLQPQQGEIKLFGQQRQWRTLSRDPRVAYIPQQLGLVRNYSVESNVLTGALSRVNPLFSVLGIFPKEIRSEAQVILQKLGIDHKAQEPVYNLSGGERQRVAIARAFMQQAKLILVDEFVSQLDPITADKIMKSVKEMAQTGVTFMITTHKLSDLSQYAQRVIILRDGQKVLDAEAGQIPDDQQLLALMGLVVKANLKSI